jgi:glycosyltransferase involved in cell wall biosynthesis
MPLVSIIMPTCNPADTIQRAIRSVQAQTLTDWKLITVDDGSTDNTVELIAGCEPRMKLICQENQGTGGARNTGSRARPIPGGQLACRLYALSFKTAYVAGLIRRREISISKAVHKLLHRIFNLWLGQKEVNL